MYYQFHMQLFKSIAFLIKVFFSVFVELLRIAFAKVIYLFAGVNKAEFNLFNSHIQ